jgi:hypothetical protein
MVYRFNCGLLVLWFDRSYRYSLISVSTSLDGPRSSRIHDVGIIFFVVTSQSIFQCFLDD